MITNRSGLVYSRSFAGAQPTQQLNVLTEVHSSADELIAFIQSANNVSSAMLHNDSGCDDLHTVVGRNKRKVQLRVISEGSDDITTNYDVDVSGDNQMETEMNTEVSSVIDQLRCTSNGKLFLGMAWTTKHATDHFAKHPH